MGLPAPSAPRFDGLGRLAVRLAPALRLSDEQLLAIARMNRDLRLERDALGALIVMPPTGGETGERNAEIVMQLRLWAKQRRIGAVFDSSTGFRLPNGTVRSPDAAWVGDARWHGLSAEQRRGFPPLCPDFVIELRSPNDNLAHLREKMREYLDNGARLGWLLDTERGCVAIYRPGEEPREVQAPAELSASPLLPDFVLDCREIW